MAHFIQELLQHHTQASWFFHVGVMALVSMIPFAPIPVLATFIATNYSFMQGLAINVAGTTIGSVLLFVLSKYVLRTLAEKYVARYAHLTKFMDLVKRNGFLAVFIGRIVPILPSAGINLIAGICHVSLVAFVAATVLGKLPTIIAFSLAGHQMAAGNWDTVMMIALYLLALLLIARHIKRKWTNESPR